MNVVNLSLIIIIVLIINYLKVINTVLIFLSSSIHLHDCKELRVPSMHVRIRGER